MVCQGEWLYAKVSRMRADVAMEVVSPDLGVLSLEVGKEISVGKRVPVLCGQESPHTRFQEFPHYSREIDFTVLKLHQVLEKVANEYDDWCSILFEERFREESEMIEMLQLK